MEWSMIDAKNRFDELVTLALTTGPQRVRGGKDELVVLAAEDYDRLTNERQTFKQYLTQGPSLEGLDLKRDATPMRECSTGF